VRGKTTKGSDMCIKRGYPVVTTKFKTATDR